MEQEKNRFRIFVDCNSERLMIFLKEIRYRKWNFLLGVLGMITAVAVVVFFVIMTRASQNETRILTRDMGFNLRIIPDSTNMNDFWIQGYSNVTMPQEYVNVLVDKKAVYYAHLTATLHQRIQWQGLDVILTGISPDELNPKGKKRSKMIFAVPPGRVIAGYEIARAAKIRQGDTLDILGKDFVVERTLSETGSEDDIRLYFDLTTLQHLLHKEGAISEIMALNCICSADGDDPLGALRRQLEADLPDAKVIMNRTIAVARERQRKMLDNFFAVLLPVLLIIAAIWVGTISMINVMQRMQEIGILRALGYRNLRIAGIFFARAGMMGVTGALLGFALGTWLALSYGPQVFKVTASAVKPLYSLLGWSVCLAPLFAALASFIPVMYAISHEPAEMLKEER
jgi:ABC-type lipoprotein release transport system permease subunit